MMSVDGTPRPGGDFAAVPVAASLDWGRQPKPPPYKHEAWSKPELVGVV